jgi:uncharacterized DUF497 family protein
MKELSFDWDQWNVQKNELKHGISALETESAFYDTDAAIFADIYHSTRTEQRWILYGRSMFHNVLMVAFTIRNKKIRVISARKASRKERSIYEKNHTRSN